MDVNDWTGNGYDDITLANMAIGPTTLPPDIEEEIRQAPSFILLLNQAN